MGGEDPFEEAQLDLQVWPSDHSQLPMVLQLPVPSEIQNPSQSAFIPSSSFQIGASTSASSPTASQDMLHSIYSFSIVATDTKKNTGNTMQGAGGNNPMVQGDIKAGTKATVNFGYQVNIQGDLNLGAEEYQVVFV